MNKLPPPMTGPNISACCAVDILLINHHDKYGRCTDCWELSKVKKQTL